ncbi:methyltransferase domain-containing protein [Maribacter sp. 2307ULW6-5]|uniref:methyltransferase domain-containing protein n=1 Tax=Maribacter sp. 2307ULW6-5 TaxID=3386275 RepID=UPI0039BC52F4
MIDVSVRSTQRELMDDFNGSVDELRVILKDINRVNALLGGNRITVNAVFSLIAAHPKESYTIMDVGCADGNMLRALALEARKRGVALRLVGVDLNAHALAIAKEASRAFPEISYLEQDVLHPEVGRMPCDLVLATLTMHHFPEDLISQFTQRFLDMARIGVVINDLHRNALAYYLFHAFSLFFIKTRTAKIDGLRSIQRAFTRADLQQFAQALPQATHRIAWKWAFRYLWVFQHKTQKTQ